MGAIGFASGCTVPEPLGRLRVFCAEEYAFYDAVLDHDPNHVDAADVAITIAVNSFVNNAARLRQVQRGLAECCDPILARIPIAADLATDDASVSEIRSLLRAAVAVPQVLVPTATKVLHRKRRRLIPMLDQVVIDYYLDALPRRDLRGSTQNKDRAAETAGIVLDALRADLLGATEQLAEIQQQLAAKGFVLTPVRILDILLWTQVEPRAYYRS